jgi:hypothetical protein
MDKRFSGRATWKRKLIHLYFASSALKFPQMLIADLRESVGTSELEKSFNGKEDQIWAMRELDELLQCPFGLPLTSRQITCQLFDFYRIENFVCRSQFMRSKPGSKFKFERIARLLFSSILCHSVPFSLQSHPPRRTPLPIGIEKSLNLGPGNSNPTVSENLPTVSSNPHSCLNQPIRLSTNEGIQDVQYCGNPIIGHLNNTNISNSVPMNLCPCGSGDGSQTLAPKTRGKKKNVDLFLRQLHEKEKKGRNQ